MFAADGYLYAVWETRDDGTSQGKDVDVVYRIFNATLEGTGWSTVVYQASPAGDREGFTPDGEHTFGDDDHLALTRYKNRVMALWRTFDPITGRQDHSDLVLRFLSDFDNDGDGFTDSVDACPADPTEHRDSDSDGVCDGRDDYPNDAERSVRQVIGGGETSYWISAVIVIVVLIAMLALLLGMSARARAKAVAPKEEKAQATAPSTKVRVAPGPSPRPKTPSATSKRGRKD